MYLCFARFNNDNVHHCDAGAWNSKRVHSNDLADASCRKSRKKALTIMEFMIIRPSV